MLFLLGATTILALAGGSSRPSDTTDIRAATLKYAIESILPRDGGGMSAVCVSFAGRYAGSMLADDDAGAGLTAGILAALPKYPVPIRPGSVCSTSRGAPMPTVETATGKNAVSVTIGPPAIAGDARATIGLQVRINGRNAAGYQCEAVRKDAQWKLSGCKRTWIS